MCSGNCGVHMSTCTCTGSLQICVLTILACPREGRAQGKGVKAREGRQGKGMVARQGKGGKGRTARQGIGGYIVKDVNTRVICNIFAILQTYYKTVFPDVLQMWSLQLCVLAISARSREGCQGKGRVAREGRQGKRWVARQGKGGKARDGRLRSLRCERKSCLICTEFYRKYYKTVSPDVLRELRLTLVGPHLYGKSPDLCSGFFGGPKGKT
jgi:hypothetical protein